MGRKKIGIAQERFDFAITPRSEHDRYIVQTLQAMKTTNELSTWLRSLVYGALPLPAERTDKPNGQATDPSVTNAIAHSAQPNGRAPTFVDGNGRKREVVPWSGKSSPKPGK